MTFGIWYCIGIMVVTWLMVIENIFLSSYSELAKRLQVSATKFWLITIGISLLAALVWPVFILWDIACIVYKIYSKKEQ